MAQKSVKAAINDHPVLSDEALELIAARFRMLSEPMRLRLLNTLREHELSVGELVEQTGAGQANVSKHLGMLLDAGLVARRREGNNVFYRIADESIFTLCDVVCTSVGDRLVAQHQVLRRLIK